MGHYCHQRKTFVRCAILVLLLLQFGFFRWSILLILPQFSGEIFFSHQTSATNRDEASSSIPHRDNSQSKGDVTLTTGEDFFAKNSVSIFSTFQDPRQYLELAPAVSSASPSSCQRILLYASSQLDPNGIGAQLNTYWQAVLTAVATNRSLVLLHRNRKSYFGCVVVAADDNATTLPGGLSRLVHTPAWLTGNHHCGLPCDKGVLEWLQVAHDLGHTSHNFSRHLISCRNSGERAKSQTSVLLLGGYSLRDYFAQRVVPVLNQTEYVTTVWAARFDAKTHSAKNIRHLADALSQQSEVDDSWHQRWIQQVLGGFVQLGVISLQPWIAQSVYEQQQAWIQHQPEAATLWRKNEFFIGVHVRRGDKLLVEAKAWVDQYWEEHQRQNSTQPLKHIPNYIPFSAYMKHIVQASRDHGQANHRLIHVYIATDDPATVRGEIDSLPPPVKRGFRFWFHPAAADDDKNVDSVVVGHIREATDCASRYNRTLAAVIDLILLTRATVFVGEFNSNWGRLIRTHRTKFDDERQAYVRDTRIVWGPETFLWPR